ncbi:hypothetical protein HPB47_019842 [Ixodes persulcatus]|uniref:Uncharacterized protein n=1 Tax=Ixodes persulcatus TaxID=34615 RepID=A0AC60QH62_IXOPE|nr:hypothetical protein HPB47_019842 [Ixodes persulcatus]
MLRFRRKTFSYFKEIGVSGPPPSFIWGNLWEYHRKAIPHCDWACEHFLAAVRKIASSGKEENVDRLFKPLAMDYISGGFGIQNCFQEEPTHPLFLTAKKVLPGIMTGPFHMMRRHIKVEKKLTPTEVSVNTAILLTAGFSTTSVALSNLSFVLAKYPEVQDKIREEVNAAVRKHGSINYAAVTEDLKYLSNVVDETMRVYSVVVAFSTRSALNDFEYKGIEYKAGMSIMSPTLEVHKDPKYWPEPEKFDPDRFLPKNVAERHTMAYQPFGQGPRNCVGKRLALLAVNYTAARMVHQFRLELGESQQEKNEMLFYAMICEPKDGPWIKFSKIASTS